MNFQVVYIFLLGFYYKGLNSEDSNVFRISNGDKKGLHKPYFAQIVLTWKYCCGGTIISDRAVLTAAQCLFSTVLDDYKIYIGSTEREKGVVHHIINIVVHPEYDAHSFVNDIGILITKYLILFKKGLIELLPISSKRTSVEPDSNILVMGFGRDNESWGDYATFLDRATLKVKSHMTCMDTLKKLILPVTFTQNQFCTIVGKDEKDVCRADPGGPVVYENSLIGVISWGIGCGRVGYPTIYTYVPKYKHWINDNMTPRDMADVCTGSEDWTRFYTVILTIENKAQCACTILSGRSCLTVSTCIPYEDDAYKYKIYHEGKYKKVESIETGHKINAMWTAEAFDLLIVKFDFMQYEEHYGPPEILCDDTVKTNYTTGILTKNYNYQNLQPYNLYSQNEKILILDITVCQIKYKAILPFTLTTNHFCISNYECNPVETKLHICADLDGSAVYNNFGELIGLIVWNKKCHTHGMAIGVYLTKYFQGLRRSQPDILEE